MTLETKHFEIEELKADDADGLLTFEGYASTFNNVDNQKDVILPGAFAKHIASRGDEIVLLWQHDTREPIGKARVREDKRGLFLNGTLSRTDTGVKAHTLLKDGVIRQMSIGYTPKDYEIDPKKGVRQLKDLALWEASLVTFPANEKALVTNVKSAPQTLREFEEFLREAGNFSRDDATTIALHGFKTLTTQGEPDEEVTTALRDIARLFNQIKA